MAKHTKSLRIDSFDLQPGRLIGGKYEVEARLGGGWEGEVYKVTERRTGATRAAKLFFPQRNERDKAVDFYARKLETLRDCPLVIKYHHSETMRYRGIPTTVLISEYVEGALLERLIRSRPGNRLHEFEALCILYELVRGLEQIHAKREYHGDLHEGNILVQRRGVHFDVKVVDLYNLGRPTAANIREDVMNCIRILHQMIGGQKHYAKQRDEIKHICGGLRYSIIQKRFPTARRLREHLDQFEWSTP